MNLSTTTLNSDEMDLLKRGLKYSVPPLSEKGIIEQLDTDIAPSVFHRPEELIDQLSNTLHTTTIPVIRASQQTVINSLRSKISTNDLVLRRADKGFTIVLLDRTDYNSKMDDCLTSINAQADPDFNFVSYNTKVRASINKSTLFVKQCWNQGCEMKCNLFRLLSIRFQKKILLHFSGSKQL